MRVTILDPGNGRCIALRENRMRDRIGLWLTRLEGWDGTPAPRESATDRPWADGTYRTGMLPLPGRNTTIGIVGRLPRSISVGKTLDAINGMIGRQLELHVENPMGDRWASCRIADSVEPQILHSGRSFTLELVLYADDPLKYGSPTAYKPENGRLTVENTGNAPTMPIIRMTGNPTAMSVTLDGRTVSWTGNGRTGEVTVDFASAAASSGALSSDDVYPIPAGTSTLNVSVSPAAATLEMLLTPAWR